MDPVLRISPGCSLRRNPQDIPWMFVEKESEWPLSSALRPIKKFFDHTEPSTARPATVDDARTGPNPSHRAVPWLSGRASGQTGGRFPTLYFAPTLDTGFHPCGAPKKGVSSPGIDPARAGACKTESRPQLLAPLGEASSYKSGDLYLIGQALFALRCQRRSSRSWVVRAAARSRSLPAPPRRHR